MTNEQIQAIGNLLEYYYSDLTYIRNFHRYKTGILEATDYLQKTNGTFKSFINEYRVARNVDKSKTDVLLHLTMEWISNDDSDNVDEFAENLKANSITHGKVMTSLASKILFLNNPWKILPLDNLVRNAVGLTENNYSKYQVLTEDYRQKNNSEIELCLKTVDQHLSIIEAEFENEITNIKTIRQNRYLDKLLWTIGQKKQTYR